MRSEPKLEPKSEPKLECLTEIGITEIGITKIGKQICKQTKQNKKFVLKGSWQLTNFPCEHLRYYEVGMAEWRPKISIKYIMQEEGEGPSFQSCAHTVEYWNL